MSKRIRIAGVSARELGDAARGGMQAHLQGVEGKLPGDRDRQLAVEHETLARQRKDKLDDFGEVAPERLARFGEKLGLAGVPESEAAKAVPFRLELPARLVGQRVDRARLHRRNEIGRNRFIR